MSTQALTTNTSKKDIRSYIQSDAVKTQLAMVLPKHITSDRMARVVCTAIMRSPKLAQCTQESLLNCMMQCSQFGLEPDGRRAHLIPFENRHKGTVECTLILDWKGLAELALRSGTIAKLHADLICDKDEFAYDLGEVLHHKINFREPRGEPYAAYAMAVTKTGGKFMQVMTQDEIEKIRDGSQGWKAFKAGYAKQSPWQDSMGEMWKKTVFRRLAKWLPLSPEFRDAVETDDDILPAPTSSVSAPSMDLPALPEFSSPEQPPIVEASAEVVQQTAPTKPEPPPAAPKPRQRAAKTQPELTVAEPTPAQAAPEAVDLALAAAMQKHGVYGTQVIEFYNVSGNIRVEGLPEVKTIGELPENIKIALAKALNSDNPAIIAKLKAIAPV